MAQGNTHRIRDHALSLARFRAMSMPIYLLIFTLTFAAMIPSGYMLSAGGGIEICTGAFSETIPDPDGQTLSVDQPCPLAAPVMAMGQVENQWRGLLPPSPDLDQHPTHSNPSAFYASYHGRAPPAFL